MNKLQEAQKEILLEFDKICKNNKINYSLAYGTALGAARHKGFIPWDDDVDVFLIRSEYDKMCLVWEKSAKPNLFLQSYMTELQYPYPFAKIRNSETTQIEPLCQKLNINHGVFIDIFCFDYVPDNTLSRFWQKLCALVLWIIIKEQIYDNRFKSKIAKSICFIFKVFSKKKLFHFLESQIGKYPEEKSSYIANFNFGTGYAKWLMPKNIFSEFVDIDFEGDPVSIISGYEAMLRNRYGNYMQLPPESERYGGHESIILDLEKSYKKYFNK